MTMTGGSCVLGTFGYLDTVEELINQGLEYDHLVFACGSGKVCLFLSF